MCSTSFNQISAPSIAAAPVHNRTNNAHFRRPQPNKGMLLRIEFPNYPPYGAKSEEVSSYSGVNFDDVERIDASENLVHLIHE